MEEPKVKKTENMNKYMSDYMKQRYEANPQQYRRYKNSLNIKKKYDIPDEISKKYKDNLYAVVSMKEIIDDLPAGFFEQFLMDYKTLNFKKKD
jgi:hypothetical protein